MTAAQVLPKMEEGVPSPSTSLQEATLWFKETITRIKQQQENTRTKDEAISVKLAQEVNLCGMTSTTKDMYEGEEKCECCINWVDSVPSDAKEDEASQVEAKKHALLVRHKKSHDMDRSKYVLHSIKIQSPLLRNFLGEALRGYPGVTTDLENLTFEAPFRPFFYRLPQLREAARNECDPTTLEHLDLLFGAIGPELSTVLSTYEDYVSKNVITYDALWTLFSPGTLVRGEQEEEESVFLVREEVSAAHDETGREVGMNIPYSMIDYDGDGFGWAQRSTRIGVYKGTRAITKLGIFPLEFHPRKEELRDRLIERGEKFEHLQGIHYVNYKGFIRWSDEYRQMMQLTPRALINGRVVVDAKGFSDFAYWDPINISPLGDTYDPEGKETWEYSRRMEANMPHIPKGSSLVNPMLPPMPVVHHPARNMRAVPLPPGRPVPLPPHMRKRLHAPRAGGPPGVRRHGCSIRPLLPQEHLLCSAIVRGYALGKKKWVQMGVDGINNITWGEGAFDKLVLPTSVKNTVMTLVEGQLDDDRRDTEQILEGGDNVEGDRENKKEEKHSIDFEDEEDGNGVFDDFMPGKGRGVVFLLAGSPGVGKTLTAETVAEHLRVPLYRLTARDLGADCNESEETLEKVFPMMVRWKAVLLLDEADVFLARRSLETTDTNRVVSVFLRMLEYYRGILFMTTNRVDTIDPAIKSRVHITLTYKDLNSAARKSIWHNFVRISRQDVDISEDDLALLSEVDMNGRQIKNVFKIAGLLASRQKFSLGVKHVKAAMEVAATETTEIGAA